MLYGSIKKEVVEDYLELDSRTTIYNYYSELKIFAAELSQYLCQDIEISYEVRTREFILEKGNRR